ncbi:MAG: response regulator [Kiritimatiellae bacterium]|nr:response regulator [Kiritimatiellia bacterium]MDD5522157.1 response regulator [Kiritimatiellia bacterium]
MKKVLLVDDETMILNILDHYFTTGGWDVLAISDSGQAAEILKSEDKFDILVSDIRMMPVNGIELLKLAKETRPAMPVILITGFGSNELFTQVMELGAFKCISKPFEPETLLKTVEEALRTK